MDKYKIGDTPRRVEDARFLTGSGCFVDDLQPDNLAHAVIVRSAHTNAELRKVHASTAKIMPGVIAVLTGDDLDGAGIGPLEPYEKVNVYSGEPFRFPTQYPLARDQVRYAGEPVALVIATTQAEALDAAEAILVDYTPQPAVVTIRDAVDSGDLNRICLKWTHNIILNTTWF